MITIIISNYYYIINILLYLYELIKKNQILYIIYFYIYRPKAALAAIKKKMTNANPHVALFALLVRKLNALINILLFIYYYLYYKHVVLLLRF